MEIKDINIDDYNISYQDNGNVITLTRKIKYPKWDDLNKISGVFISIDSYIRRVTNSSALDAKKKHISYHKTRKIGLGDGSDFTINALLWWRDH